MPWVQAATSITSGLDADKPAIPAIGDMYGATDTQKLYVCFTAGTWTKVSYLANSSSGTLANLPASPQVGDTYFVTDLNIQVACFTAGVWTTISKRTKVGSFTRDLTLAAGTQEITGVGFTPGVLIFLATVNTTAMSSVGFDNIANHMSQYQDTPSGNDIMGVSAQYSIGLNETAINVSAASVTGTGTDGFTLTWVKGGVPSGTVFVRYLALEA